MWFLHRQSCIRNDTWEYLFSLISHWLFLYCSTQVTAWLYSNKTTYQFSFALPSRKININFKPHPLSLPLYHCYFALVMTEWLQCDKESNFKCLRKTEKVTDLVLYCRKEQKQLDVSDNGTIQPLTKFFHKFAIRMASYRSKCTLHASLCAIKLDK